MKKMQKQKGGSVVGGGRLFKNSGNLSGGGQSRTKNRVFIVVLYHTINITKGSRMNLFGKPRIKPIPVRCYTQSDSINHRTDVHIQQPIIDIFFFKYSIYFQILSIICYMMGFITDGLFLINFSACNFLCPIHFIVALKEVR